ncbi:MAG: hypothetical protein ACI4VL_04615 [Bacilli bacterium]
MLLSDNTKRVIDLLEIFDNLKDIDKIRLVTQILENLHFSTKYDIDSFIKLLKEILLYLDPNYNKTITNFAKYKDLLFISSKYSELSLLEKQKFSVEMLFNVFEYDFKNQEINEKINKQLNVYDYCYSLNVL